MHTSTQIVAQRAPSATRTKARWQPYSMVSSSSTLPFRSPMAPYLNTPKPSVSSPPPIANQSCDSTRIRPLQLPIAAQTPKDSSPRDISKQRFATGLIGRFIIQALPSLALTPVVQIKQSIQYLTSGAHRMFLGFSSPRRKARALST